MSFLRTLQRYGLARQTQGRDRGRRVQARRVGVGVAQVEALEGRALLSTLAISTVAGSGNRSFAGDGGSATLAGFKTPLTSAVDSAGNIFIADQYNLRVREVVAATGNVITVAGNGGGGPLGGYTGDGGQATAAQLSNVSSVAVDAKGNLYIGDFTNHVVRQVNLNTGIITTVAGKQGRGAPYVPAVSDGMAATAVELGNPAGMVLDPQGNLYIADSADHVVLRVDAATHTIRAVAGNGTANPNPGVTSGDGGAATAAQLSSPRGVALNSQGDLFISDMLAMTVRKVDHSTGKINTVAGIGGYGYFSGDGGPATAAKLYTPQGIAVDAQGNLLIADTANNRIRKVDTAGIITTLIGSGTLGFAGDGGAASAAQLNSPQGVTLDTNGYIYVTDSGNQRVRMATTAVTTTTSLATSNAAAAYGQACTFTASVSPSSANGYNVGGSVQFTVDGKNYGAPVVLNSQGQALLSIASWGAGSHTLGARFAGDPNFQPSSAASLSQTVNKAVLMVKANAASGRAGNPLPALTASYSGFVNGDTVASLSSTPTLSTTATQASPAGSYPISVTGGSAQNYTISTVGSTLTLTPPIKPLSVKGVYSGTKLTGVTIVFNGPMSVPSAQSLANYTVVSPGKDGKYGTKDDVKVALTSAVYSSAKTTVTLKLKAGVAITPGMQLKAASLLDSLGGKIDGAHNGTPGSVLTATFKGRTVTF